MLSDHDVQAFQTFIHRYQTHYGRQNLPWRGNYDPYRIMVSEIMLQQTQVDRVIPKFEAFIKVFPDVNTLATAPVSQVITQWQGLGYNRRGLNLQRAAQAIVEKHLGQLPATTEELIDLPGIGPYTAAAIQAFAFNQPSLVIETNIRTVILYHFFHGAYNVNDYEILDLVKQTLDRENPRLWYSTLMDYGTYLKQVVPNPTRRSQQYVKQSKFEGSLRQVRGAILKVITTQGQSQESLKAVLPFSPDRIDLAVSQLVKEGFLTFKNHQIQLAE